MRHLAFVAALLVAPAAFAQQAPNTRVQITNNILSGVALNAAAGTRTITANNYYAGTPTQPAFAKARLSIFYTYSAATAVTVVFSCSADGTNFAQMTARDISGSTATISALTDSYTTGAASKDLMLEYDIRGCAKVKWLLAGTGAGAGDLVTVDLALIAGN